jgi:hypothetical protein
VRRMTGIADTTSPRVRESFPSTSPSFAILSNTLILRASGLSDGWSLTGLHTRSRSLSSRQSGE